MLKHCFTVSLDITDKQLHNFEKIIGYKFKNRNLLLEALTHRTFAHESRDKDVKDNQRLEFLGDTVLGLVISQFLYQFYPDYSEGQLTKLKSHLVSADVLSRQAARIHLGDYLRLGKGEKARGGQTQGSNLAAAFEAIVASVYLDGGLEPASRFILRQLKEEIKLVKEGKSAKNYKSLLQELTARRFGVIPAYEIVSQAGPDHVKTFKIVAKINDRIYGHGQGPNRKAAEQAAAGMALKKLEVS